MSRVRVGLRPGSLHPWLARLCLTVALHYIITGEFTREEQALRDFDLTTRYGPAAGMSRLER